MVWGYTTIGKFEEPTMLTKLTKTFVDVDVGLSSGYAVTDDGEVWTWGKNENGELGVSDYEPRMKPFPMKTLEQEHIQSVHAGIGFACCVCTPRAKSKPSQRRYSHCVAVSPFNGIEIQKKSFALESTKIENQKKSTKHCRKRSSSKVSEQNKSKPLTPKLKKT